MHLRIELVFAAAIALALLPARAALAAPEDDLKNVLDRLNVAAANFHSASADVEFDDITTAPIYDKDVFKGVVYYDRKANAFRMGVHFNQHNDRPSTKAYTYVGGVLKVHESDSEQVTTYAQAGKWESYVMLGFGASGTDLLAKWEIKDMGWETIGGVKTAILEMVAKDPDVRKNLSTVTIWVDPDRAVSLKQVFTLSATSSKVCLYSNFKLNQSLPSDAFTFKADHQTAERTQ
jgi:outer membrane lipoprotein-sorting protein